MHFVVGYDYEYMTRYYRGFCQTPTRLRNPHVQSQDRGHPHHRIDLEASRTSKVSNEIKEISRESVSSGAMCSQNVSSGSTGVRARRHRPATPQLRKPQYEELA